MSASRWSKRTLMDEYFVWDFVLDNIFTKCAFKVPTGVPTWVTSLESWRLAQSSRAWTHPWLGGGRLLPGTSVQSAHLISMAGLLCRLSCAGHVARESGLVNFSLLPVLPQNTLSNSYSWKKIISVPIHRHENCFLWKYKRLKVRANLLQNIQLALANMDQWLERQPAH